ncbi:MAG: hypothetical protein WBB82_03310 [Limnothrix sp.]
MNTVEIQSVSDTSGKTFYRATSGAKSSVGATMEQALDALMQELEEMQFPALLVSQTFQPDIFFSASQQKRLAELMNLWRSARDKGTELESTLQKELDTLVELELEASVARVNNTFNRYLFAS